MISRLLRVSLATALAIIVAAVLCAVVDAQDGEQPQGGAQSARAAASSVPTPRTPDGHPDLSGFWAGGGATGRGTEIKPDESGNLKQLNRARPCHPGQADCAPGVNEARDSTFTGRMSANRPQYKPEFWEKVRYLDQNTNTEDPGLICQPAGVPRMGVPTKIVQTAAEVIFLYQQGGASAQNQDFRVIPIDGRPHDPIKSQDLTYYGDAVGHWEGDTLVIDSIGFNDITWLDRAGYFHSANMRVIEKLTRQGNTLTWQATVEDPDVLMKPWTMDARRVNLNTNPRASMMEGLPCEERDRAHMVTKEHH